MNDSIDRDFYKDKENEAIIELVLKSSLDFIKFKTVGFPVLLKV